MTVSEVPRSLRLPVEIDERLSRLAAATGRSKSYYLRELVTAGIDDLEYAYGIATPAEAIPPGPGETPPRADLPSRHPVAPPAGRCGTSARRACPPVRRLPVQPTSCQQRLGAVCNRRRTCCPPLSSMLVRGAGYCCETICQDCRIRRMSRSSASSQTSCTR